MRLLPHPLLLTTLLVLPVAAQQAHTPQRITAGTSPYFHVGGIDSHSARVAVALREDFRMVKVSVSQDCGTTWASPVRVDQDPGLDNKAPTHVRLHKERVYVLWSDWRGFGTQLYLGLSTDGGLSFGEHLVVSQDVYAWDFEVVEEDDDPASDRLQLLVVTEDASLGGDIYLVTSVDGGQSWSGLQSLSALNGTPDGDVVRVDLVADENRVAFVSADQRTSALGGDSVVFRNSTDGTNFCPELRLDDGKSNYHPDVQIDAEGDRIAVGWLQYRILTGSWETIVRVSTDGGLTFGPQRKVGKPHLIGSHQDEMRLGVVDGNVVCLFLDDRTGSTQVYVGVSTDGGLNYTVTQLSSGTDHSDLRLSADGSRVVVAWTDRSSSHPTFQSSHSQDGGLTWSQQIQIDAAPNEHSSGVLTLNNLGHLHATWSSPWGVEDIWVGGYTTVPAAVVSRTAGTNVDVFDATIPTLGSPWTATVDTTLTGHDFAVLRMQSKPATVPLRNGYYFLLGGFLILESPLLPGPQATFQVPLPNDPCLSGFTTSSQAVLLGGVTPFALTNARDLTIGSY